MFAWQAHEGVVTSLAFGPDGRFLVSTGDDGCVRVWEPFTGAEQLSIPLRIPERYLRFLTVSADGTTATVARQSEGLVLLDLVGGAVITDEPTPHVAAAKLAPDGRSVVVLSNHNIPNSSPDVISYALADRSTERPPLTGYRGTSRALAFSPDGSRIAVGRTVHEWPPVSNGHVITVYTKDYEPDDLAFSANNEYLFASVGGKVAVYALPSGLFKMKLRGHCDHVTALQLSSDGRRLWTASLDATVKCWDTFSLTLDRTFRFGTGGLGCLAVSPDGNVAAVGSGQKGTITVWDLG